MKNLISDNGLRECNGNILAVLGQMNFIEQLKEQMNNLKSDYGDNKGAIYKS
jgi:hypothetical protein